MSDHGGRVRMRYLAAFGLASACAAVYLLFMSSGPGNPPQGSPQVQPSATPTRIVLTQVSAPTTFQPLPRLGEGPAIVKAMHGNGPRKFLVLDLDEPGLGVAFQCIGGGTVTVAIGTAKTAEPCTGSASTITVNDPHTLFVTIRPHHHQKWRLLIRQLAANPSARPSPTPAP